MENIEVLDKLWKASNKNINLKLECEDKIKQFILKNNKFSIEYLTLESIKKGYIIIVFIASSENYFKFGEQVNVKIIESEYFNEKIKNNILSDSYGNFKAKVIIENQFVKKDNIIDIKTNNILKILN